MAFAALVISIISIGTALLAMWYTRKQANAAVAHARTAAEHLDLEQTLAGRAEDNRQPRLWVEKTGPSGGGGDAWSGTATVHNDGGSHARQVKVEVRVKGERVGASTEVHDIPAKDSRDFRVNVYQPSRFGGNDAIEQLICFYARDAVGHEGHWQPR